MPGTPSRRPMRRSGRNHPVSGHPDNRAPDHAGAGAGGGRGNRVGVADCATGRAGGCSRRQSRFDRGPIRSWIWRAPAWRRTRGEGVAYGEEFENHDAAAIAGSAGGGAGGGHVTFEMRRRSRRSPLSASRRRARCRAGAEVSPCSARMPGMADAPVWVGREADCPVVFLSRVAHAEDTLGERAGEILVDVVLHGGEGDLAAFPFVK